MKHPYFGSAALSIVSVLVSCRCSEEPPSDHRPLADADKVEMAKVYLKHLGEGLDLYKLKHGRYPESMDPLVPSIFKTIPADAWGNRYVYERDASSRGFRLGCLGADGKPGGSGYGADIWLSEIE